MRNSIEHSNGGNTVDDAREGFHRRIGTILTTTADVGIGAVSLGAYGVARAARGVLDVGKSVKRGLEGKSYDQAA